MDTTKEHLDLNDYQQQVETELGYDSDKVDCSGYDDEEEDI